MALCISGCMALACYFTPNAVLRQISPKRYVLNACSGSKRLMKKQLGLEAERQPCSVVFDFLREEQELLSAGAEWDFQRVNFFCSPLLEQEWFSISRGTLEAQKYFALPHIYRKCCEVRRKNNKKILLSSGKLSTADVFEITFRKEQMKKLLELAKKLQQSDVPVEQRQQWKQLLEQIQEIAVTVSIDRSGKVREINAVFSRQGTPVYAELLLTDADVYVNRLEARVFTRGQSNMTWSLKSAGNHRRKEGAVDDVTELSILKSYLQITQLTFQTTVKDGQVASAVSGDILGHRLEATGEGTVVSGGEKQLFSEIFSVTVDAPEEVRPVQEITGVSQKQPWLSWSGTYRLTMEKRKRNTAKEDVVNLFVYLKENPDFLTGRLERLLEKRE